MAAFQTGDAVGAVVADVGHYATKIGWAGDDTPRSYFQSTVAVKRDNETNSITKVQYDASFRFQGDADTTTHNWNTSNPVDSTTGLLYEKDAYELLPQFLQHGYDTALHKSSLQDHPLLLAERSYTPAPVRQEILQVLFEECQLPAVFLAKDAVLACYACGRTTATVVDVGYSGTTVTPVFDGYAETKAIRRSAVGVQAMDEYVLQQLDALHGKPVQPLYQVKQQDATTTTKQQQSSSSLASSMHQLTRLQIAQECRELGAGAAMNLVDGGTAFHAPHRPFTLPDGTILDVPSKVRFAAADLAFGDSPELQKEVFQKCQDELEKVVAAAQAAADDPDVDSEEKYSAAAAVGLSKRRTKTSNSSSSSTSKKKAPTFNPRQLQAACLGPLQMFQKEQLSSENLANMICSAAYRCDRDQQAALLANVVLGGGGTCLGPTEQAVPDAVRERMEALIHQHTAGWRVKVLTPSLSERAILTWLGGSILGSLGTFPEMWISKADYEEWGTAIVNRKCP